MKRGAIYIMGGMGTVFLAALTLPDAGRAVEARLQGEMELVLADKGLNDIQAHMNGQTVTFIYDPAADVSSPHGSRLAAQHMTTAILAAETLTGGLYVGRGGYGPVWGPIVQTRIATSSNPATVPDTLAP